MTLRVKKSFLLLILIASISTAFAQDLLKFRVVDFSYDAFDQTARDERFKRYDGSGYLYAIIKVSGDNPTDNLKEYRFNFGNMKHIVEYHDGELWLYVQKNAKTVTISRNGYFTVSHYDLNTTIESGKTYTMKLSAQAPKVYTQMVMFDVKPADSRAVITISKDDDGQGREMFGTIDETGGVAKKLRYGTYTYEVMAENYHLSEGRFTLDNQDETHIEKVELRRNDTKIILDAGVDTKIYVKFDVKPADSKAVITISKEDDGQGREMFGIIDETGGVAKNLRYGTYTYDVIAENYYPSEGRFTLDNQTETHIEKVVLRSNGANITLDAGKDVEIYINGIKHGTNKWTGLLKVGSYNVECRMANHRPSQQNINVEVGKDRVIPLASPMPITGTLSLNSIPLGASIKIDGMDYGTTPMNITDILIGHHNLILSKEGYASKSEECDIHENETLSLDVVLEESMGAVTQAGAINSDRTFTVGNVSFTMKPVAGGTFIMGATPEQGSDFYVDEKPAHKVTLSSYMIGETEVTQELWMAVMGSNPSYFRLDVANLPVDSVSWNDCQKFIKKLNKMTGQKFRLPTEAEWEFAARGGNKSRGYKYSGSNYVEDVAWYDDNSGGYTHVVKTKSPNELGIYDMSGNIYEWCYDNSGIYTSDAQTNPVATIKKLSLYRAARGGSWYNYAGKCRVSGRAAEKSDSCYSKGGLRLAMDFLK